ncbi:hypothetical protein BH20CHL6_BH20CHL6_08320 [soil metagenome]
MSTADDRDEDVKARGDGAELSLSGEGAVLDRLAELAQSVGTARDLQTVYRALLEFAVATTPTSGIFVSLYDAERQERTCVYAWSAGHEEDVSRLPALPMTDSPNSRSVATNQVIVTDDLAAALVGQPRVDIAMDVDPRQPQSSVAVPMAVLGRVIGGFEVQSVSRAAFTSEHVTAMQMAANLAAIATENVRLLDREREARTAAETSEQRFRDLVHGLEAIVYEAEGEPAQFTFVSQHAEQMLGFPVQTWLDDPKLWSTHLHPEDREATLAAYGGASAGERREVEYRFIAADGRVVWVRDVVVQSETGGGRPSRRRGVMIDLTERRQLEAQVLEAQKMESVGRLAGGIAHDFNNLLTAIIGYNELLMGELPSESPERADAEQIRRAAERAAALTGQLLAFSRRQVLQPQVLDLEAVIRELAPMLRRLLGRDVELTIRADPGLGQVQVDRAQIEQVIVNLAVNARDAMPSGGSLVISTGNIELDEGYSGEHVGVAAGRYVVATVSDTGVGMDATVRAHIFEPFFSTRKQGKGTGLGLATVYGIIRQSGGYVWVYSEPDAGSTFKIYLPRVDAGQIGDDAGGGE